MNKSPLYSTFADQYDLAVRNNIYNARFERPSLMAMIGDVAGLDALDLGCGPGFYAEFLAEGGARKITCVDQSEQMIAITRRKLGDRITAYARDLSLGLPDEANASADLIICPLVLHYLEDLAPFFKEANRVLKPRGHIAFSTHHPFADFAYSNSGNYFERELVNQEWNTIGEPVEVEFHRRSLTEIMTAITTNGFVVTELTEGQVSAEVQKEAPKVHERISRNPTFIFIKCQKVFAISKA